MSAVLHFAPRDELSAAKNIEAFVSLCRQSNVLCAAEQFEKNRWVVGQRKGRRGPTRLQFSTLEGIKCNGDPSEEFLPSPFIDFAKAMMVYMQDHRPLVSPDGRLAALRCLEAALREHGKDARATGVNADVLATAERLVCERYSTEAAYRIAGQLEQIAQCMRDLRFIRLRMRWSHGLKVPRDRGSRLSKGAAEARVGKLPSAAVIRAVAGVFNAAIGVCDIAISSFLALMLCAPERINEVVRLRIDCFVEGEGRFAGRLGLRWPGSKGADDTVKWLPTQMALVARDAINRLIAATAPVRAVIEWYSIRKNRYRLFIHPGAEHLRGKATLTEDEVRLLVWGTTEVHRFFGQWCRQVGLKRMSRRKEKLYAFRDVERVVVSQMPSTFPAVPGDPTLLFKDSLAVVLKNSLHSTRPTYVCMFSYLDQDDISRRLGGNGATRSIFERYGHTEDDGTPIDVRSHSFRHFLNTLAQKGGLSDAEIAIFSGRRDVCQNGVYDHRTSDEVQRPIHLAVSADPKLTI